MEGFPLNRAQVDFMNQAGIIPDKYIMLQVNDTEIISERISGRRVDPVTNSVYHIKYNMPKKEQIVARLKGVKPGKELGNVQDLEMFDSVVVNANQSIEKVSAEKWRENNVKGV